MEELGLGPNGGLIYCMEYPNTWDYMPMFVLFYVTPWVVKFIVSLCFGSLTIVKTPRRKFGWLVGRRASELFGWWLSCLWLPW